MNKTDSADSIRDRLYCQSEGVTMGMDVAKENTRFVVRWLVYGAWGTAMIVTMPEILKVAFR